MERRRISAARAVVLAGVLGFVALVGAAATRYPGGTYCDPRAPRYQLWGNYVCDLTQPTTPGGRDNTASVPRARAAFVVIALGMAPFWWLVGGLAGGRIGIVVRLFGPLSAAATIAVALAPSRRWPWLHVTTVFTASIPGLVAAVSGVVGLLIATRGSPSRGLRLAAVLGTVTMLLAFVDAAGYGYVVAAGISCTPWLPAVQRLASLALLAWMVTVALIGPAHRR
jgi:hypothetical protein